MAPHITVVIGKNFGDEGKGLAVDYFSAQNPSTLVIKHNGGAQAGHTVDRQDRRFIFHQLSSGSFNGADTYWCETYFPDLFKIREEVDSFKSLSAKAPDIYASGACSVVLIDDVILNMVLETSRGDMRHGSCGMGIDEARIRTENGYGLTLAEIKSMNRYELITKLKLVRDMYVLPRIEKLVAMIPPDYAELLKSDDVLNNEADEMLGAMSLITVVEDEKAFLNGYEDIIFESGQGLLLDFDMEKFAPHITSSKTGLRNPVNLLLKNEMTPDEIVYVTRSYMTRHGRGPLPNECSKELIGEILYDRTNEYNEWQENIRYAKHSNIYEFIQDIRNDITELNRFGRDIDVNLSVSLFVTHLNETYGEVVFNDERISCSDFIEKYQVRAIFNRVYLSSGCLSEDVSQIRF